MTTVSLAIAETKGSMAPESSQIAYLQETREVPGETGRSVDLAKHTPSTPSVSWQDPIHAREEGEEEPTAILTEDRSGWPAAESHLQAATSVPQELATAKRRERVLSLDRLFLALVWLFSLTAVTSATLFLAWIRTGQLIVPIHPLHLSFVCVASIIFVIEIIIILATGKPRETGLSRA